MTTVLLLHIPSYRRKIETIMGTNKAPETNGSERSRPKFRIIVFWEERNIFCATKIRFNDVRQSFFCLLTKHDMQKHLVKN